MENKPKKRFLSNHSKSSAAIVSIALHLVLLLIAGTFVAVTVVTKSEKKFESRQASHPRMPLKKLQVPVKINKRKPKPKLRKRIVVQTTERNVPDIKMPEISGIKGGLGAAGGTGLGTGGGIGFSMPEIDVFGIRGKGERIFIALDSDAYIMRDEIGGMRAYQIIKDELVKIIEGLSPTTLFNLAVFEYRSALALFPKMVPATRENVEKVKNWLEPLNQIKVGTTGSYGLRTLGKGGVRLQTTDSMLRGEIKEEGAKHWYRPAAKAMMEQADTIFILSGSWGKMRVARGETPSWPAAKRKKWEEHVRKAKEMHKIENEKRAAEGEPERVINDSSLFVSTYFPSKYASLCPPAPPWYYYTGRDYAEALNVIREECASKVAVKSGISKAKRDRYSINVVFFAPRNEAGPVGQYEILANRCHGKFRVIKGLDEIESFVKEQGEP